MDGMQCDACASNGAADRGKTADGGMEDTREETAKLAGRAAGPTMLGLSVHLGKGLRSDESWALCLVGDSGEIPVAH